jgi:hypothetical protein
MMLVDDVDYMKHITPHGNAEVGAGMPVTRLAGRDEDLHACMRPRGERVAEEAIQ